MGARLNFVIGILAVSILASGVVYVDFANDARIRVDFDKSTFYVPHEDYSWLWVVSGREYNRLFDGGTQLNRDRAKSTITNITDGQNFVIIRETFYKRGPKIRDTYTFSGDVTYITLFPVSHKVEVFDAEGFFYRYSVDDLSGIGPFDKRKLSGETSLNFGRNMKVEFPTGYRWGHIGWPYGSDSMAVQYDVPSDYEVFNVRLFDPPIPVASSFNFTFDVNFTEGNTSTGGFLINDTPFIDNVAKIGNGSVEFDAGADYLYNESFPTRVNNFTISFWFQNLTSFSPTQVMTMYNKADLSGGAQGDTEIRLERCETSGTHGEACIRVLVGDTDLGGQRELRYRVTPTSDWTYMAMRFIEDGNLSLFVNGSLVNETAFGNNGDTNANITFGASKKLAAGPTNSFDGRMDDLRIWVDGIQPSNSEIIEDFANITLLLDGLEEDRFYELGTTANLTAGIASGNVCIEVDEFGFGPNFTCGDTSHFLNYTINITSVQSFDDNGRSINISSGDFVNVTLDNRTYIGAFEFNISGTDTLSDVHISYNDSVLGVVLDGNLSGQVLKHSRFYVSDVGYEIFNFTFTEASIKTLLINFTTNNLNENLSRHLNVSFNVDGFNINDDSQFHYDENFSNSDRISENVNTDSPMPIFQNYDFDSAEVLQLHDFQRLVSGTSNSRDFNNEISGGKYYVNARIEGSTGGQSGSITNIDRLNKVDLREVTRLNMSWRRVVNCVHISGSTMIGEVSIKVDDGSNAVVVDSHSVSCTSGSSSSDVDENVSIVRVHKDSDLWNYTQDGVFSGTFSTSGLDDSANWTFRVDHLGSTGGSSSAANIGQAESYIDHFHVGGVGLLMPDHSQITVVDGSFKGNTVNTTDNNIFSATVTWNSFVPNGTNVSAYASNDDGATWIPVVNGSNTLFGSGSSGLRVNFSLSRNTSVTNLSSFIYNYEVDVLTGLPGVVNHDFGCDGISDYTTNITSGSTSFFVSNFSAPLFDYGVFNCDLSGLICEVPICSISSGPGIMQVSNFSVTQRPNPISLNTSFFESLNPLNFSTTFTGTDTVGFSGLNSDFRGSKNVTVWAFDQFDHALNVSRLLKVKYSNFSKSFPANITNFEFFVRSRTARNVTPRGQGNFTPIRNISNEAYDSVVNLSVHLNNTFSENINLTYSNTSDKDDGFALTVNPQLMCSLQVGETCGIWSYLDVNITGSRFTIPRVWMCGICAECVVTSDWCENKIII